MQIKLAADRTINFFKENIYIILILTMGFFIRGYGIYFDYPFGTNNIWDEIYSMVYLLDALEYKNFFITSYNYPLLLPWMYLPALIIRLGYIALSHGIFNLNELKEFLVAGGIGQVYIIVRWYSVVFGTATIWLLYKIYSLIFKNKISLYFLSAVYATSLVPVFLSHWGKAHSIMVFFLVLSLYFMLQFEKEKNLKYFYWSAIAAACSISIHYIGISAAIFPFLGFIFNRKLINFKTLVKAFILYAAITSFFYLANLKGIEGMIDNNKGYFENTGFTGMAQTGIGERFYYVIRDSFLLDPVFTLLFVILAIISIKYIFKNNYLRYIFIGLLFNYFLMSTIIVWPQMSRWLLIFVTLAIPLGAGLFVEYLINRSLKRNLIYLICLILLIPNIFIVYFWLSLTNHNTRNEAIEWLETNLKPGEIAYSFDMYLDAPLNYEAALWHRDNNERQLSKKLNYIISHKEEFKNQGIDLRYDYNNKRYERLGGENTKYVIVYYALSGEDNRAYYNLETREGAQEYLNNVKKYHNLSLVEKFYPTDDSDLIKSGVEDYLNNPINWRDLFKLKASGPFIEIYSK